MSAAWSQLDLLVDRLAADGVDVDPAVADTVALRLGAGELRAGERLQATGDLPSVPRAPAAVAEDLDLVATLLRELRGDSEEVGRGRS